MSSDGATPDEPFAKLMQQYQRAVDDWDFEDATGTVHDIFALAEEWCDENPSPDFALTITAAEFEERADWSAAESAYNQILSLPDIEPAVEYKAHGDLAGLCRLLQRDSDALAHVRYATAAARRADLTVLLVMALQGEARCLIKCGQISEACNVIAEAISVIDDDKMYNQARASILTLRAECDIHNDADADAERDLERAYDLLEPLAGMDIAAGIHSDLSRWWSVTARLCAKRDDREGSVAAWQKAVGISKHVDSLVHADNVYTKSVVADMLKGLADALLVCDRTDDATVACDERNALLDRIGVPNTGAE